MIQNDSSKYQIGATIMQHDLLIAYFSKKLSPTQYRYITTEQEMLAIILTLKEYRNILLGAYITIFTDHENLLVDKSANDQVFFWKQRISEYSPHLKFIKWVKNKAVDALSRLSIDETNNKEIVVNNPSHYNKKPSLIFIHLIYI